MERSRATALAHPVMPAAALAASAVALTLAFTITTARPLGVPAASWLLLGTAAGFALSGSV